MATETTVACGRCGLATLSKDGASYCPACDWYTNWPPTEDAAVVWAKVEALGLTPEQKYMLQRTLNRWVDATSEVVAYEDDNGEWVDVKWPWTEET